MSEKEKEIVAFGMTRQDVVNAVNDIKNECTDNEQDSGSYTEYAQNMKKGREHLKKQSGYYPYMPKGD